MKKLYPILLALCLTGCMGTLIPKQVELGQKKVKEFPEPKPREEEVQKQAASLAAVRAQDTLVAAVSNDCPPEVVQPAHDTAVLTRAVSTVIGPPAAPYVGPVSNLVAKTDATVAKQNTRVEKFEKRNDEFVGKKIEDTGLIKVPYLLWLGGFIALLFVIRMIYIAVKAGASAYGTVNPAVGAGMALYNSAASMASNLVHRGFDQLVKGGENFKTKVVTEFEPAVAKKVLEIFQNEHVKAQDNDVKDTVSNLSKTK